MKKSEKERTLVININLTRGLVALLIVGLLALAFVGYLALGQKRASASQAAAPAAPSGGLRKYYRTATSYLPTEAITACATGYHFASLWELLDPSNLEYAGELPDASAIEDDMGEGPPTGGPYPRHGWVRTGHNDDVSAVAGQANCNTWDSTSDTEYGTSAGLTLDWLSATSYKADISVWDVGILSCDTSYGVWCVED
jgi:hypothetical protein